MPKLSVNVNKVATVRNSRGGSLPSVIEAVRTCVDAGAPGITVHPRADARHITTADVYAIAEELAPLKGRVVIIDDVITDGASKRESVEMIRAAGAEPVSVLIAMDRMERKGSDDNLSARSSVEEFEAAYGMPVLAIATLADLLQYLQSNDDPALRSHLARVAAYRDRYGV